MLWVRRIHVSFGLGIAYDDQIRMDHCVFQSATIPLTLAYVITDGTIPANGCQERVSNVYKGGDRGRSLIGPSLSTNDLISSEGQVLLYVFLFRL